MGRRVTRLDREDWIDAATDALVDGGVDAVAVEALARRLGVTKGSFYWHFQRRSELLEEVLRRWETRGTRAVITAVDDAADDPRDRLRELGRLTFTGPSTTTDRLEPALRAWATTDESAAAVMTRVDDVRLAYVRDLLVAAGIEPSVAANRAQLFYRVLIGEWVFRSTGGRALSTAALDELLELAFAAA